VPTPTDRTAAPRQPARPEYEQLGLEGMPRRLFSATPSRLGAFEDCPRRYRYTYLDRPAPPRGPAWAHNSLGASVHTALRNWYALPEQRRRVEAVPTLLRATWVREGYRDEEQERAVFQRAAAWLERYLAEVDPTDEPVGVERVVATRTRILALSGRVDRIDRRGDDLVIVDYKTGRFQPGEEDARGSRALALYAFAAERMFRRRCRRVELHHLPSGTVAAFDHTDGSLARHVARAERDAEDIVAAEAALAEGADADGTFPTTPGTLCSWCDFRAVCPAGADAPPREPWTAVEQVA
jgi:putative RecB family exonuclease